MADESNEFEGLEPVGDDESTDESTEESVDEDVDDSSADDSEGEPKGEDEDEDKDEEDLEPKEDEEPEESKESTSLYARVKKGNPKLFKDFPELRDAIHREDKFTESFPTPEVAAEVLTRYKDYVAFEEGILSGNPTSLLKSLETNNKEALTHFAHNFFPSLKELSSELHGAVMTRPMKQVFLNAYATGKRSGNEDLMNAALHLNHLYFDDEPIDAIPDLPKSVEDSPERQSLAKDKLEFEQRRYGIFHGDVTEVYTSQLRKDIGKSTVDLDITAYTRKTLEKDILSKTDELVTQDKKHLSKINALWLEAKRAGFTQDYKSKLYRMALAKARLAMPVAKRLVLQEAGLLKGGKKVASGGQSKKSVGSGNGSGSGKDIDWSKTTEANYIDGVNIVYK
jgi:hypothetical protein